jgi:endonuclease/exonuclease/phosphatase family metal-dependent hydrolase
MIKIASFNVENLYARPKAFRYADIHLMEPILKAFNDVNELFNKAKYTAADKKRMLDLLVQLGIYNRNDQGAVRRSRSLDPDRAWFRKNRGVFDREPEDATQSVEITVNGRADRVGWVELATETTNEVGFQTTGRVIREVDADILGLVEAENRPSLTQFNTDLLKNHYKHVMLVDGNDKRGIDVAILTRKNFTIEGIRSNVDLEDSGGPIFSRDCPLYEVHTPGGHVFHVLVNHFKSQSGGGGPKRKRQAKAVRDIAQKLIADGQHVVVLGDLNEGPKTGKTQAENLTALYGGNAPLVDIWSLPQFSDGGRPGSYDSCGLSNRLDYICLSPSLVPKVHKAGVFRKGLWGGRKTKPDKWAVYPEMLEAVHQASDHACLWVEVELD